MKKEPDWIQSLESSADYGRLMARERLWLEATEGLCALMDQHGLSKAELASRLGVSRSWVTQLLSGKRNLTLATLSDVSYAIGVPVHVAFYSPQESSVDVTGHRITVSVADIQRHQGHHWERPFTGKGFWSKQASAASHQPPGPELAA